MITKTEEEAEGKSKPKAAKQKIEDRALPGEIFVANWLLIFSLLVFKTLFLAPLLSSRVLLFTFFCFSLLLALLSQKCMGFCHKTTPFSRPFVATTVITFLFSFLLLFSYLLFCHCSLWLSLSFSSISFPCALFSSLPLHFFVHFSLCCFDLFHRFSFSVHVWCSLDLCLWLCSCFLSFSLLFLSCHCILCAQFLTANGLPAIVIGTGNQDDVSATECCSGLLLFHVCFSCVARMVIWCISVRLEMELLIFNCKVTERCQGDRGKEKSGIRRRGKKRKDKTERKRKESKMENAQGRTFPIKTGLRPIVIDFWKSEIKELLS